MDSSSLEDVSSVVQQTADYSCNTRGLFYVTTRLEFPDESVDNPALEWGGGQEASMGE